MQLLRKWWFWLLIILVLAFGAFSRVRRGQDEGSEVAPPEIVTAFVGDLAATTSVTGQWLPERSATLIINMSGEINTIHVGIGSEVRAGDRLVEMDVRTLENAINQAFFTAEIQTVALEQLQESPSEDAVAAAEAAVVSAEANLNAVLERNGLLETTPEPEDVEEGENTPTPSPTPEPTATPSLQQIAQITAAETQLAQARANLAALTAPVSEERLRIAELHAEQAQFAHGIANDALENATLRAPFDGIVTQLFVTQGEHYLTGPVLTIADSGSLRLVLSVDEIDIGELRVGQAATVVFEAFPNEVLAAEIVAIAPSATADPLNSAIVNYAVSLRLTDTALPLRIGMTATADLITAQRENVLLVPNRAITTDRQTGTFFVNRVTGPDDTIDRVTVTIGLRDGENTQILSGIEEGDRLAVGDFTLTSLLETEARPGQRLFGND